MRTGRLAAAAGCVLVMVVGVGGVGWTPVTAQEPVVVTDEEGLRAAVADRAVTTLSLGADLTLSDCAAGTARRLTTAPLTVDGAGHTLTQTCPAAGILESRATALTIVDITLTGGESRDHGGAVHSPGPGTVTLTRARLTGNAAPAGHGGAVFAGGPVTVTDSTIDGNTAGRHGGGIYGRAGVTVGNSTLSGNTATGSGGAGYAAGGDLALTHATVVDNQAGAAAAVAAPEGTLAPYGSVLAGGCAGPVASGGRNFAPDGGCPLDQPTDVPTGGDAGLGPLGDHGGPTPTRAPAVDSPLVDAIPAGDCREAADQRGGSRPLAAGCDIGAVELAPPEATLADDALACDAGTTCRVDVLAGDAPADWLVLAGVAGEAPGEVSFHAGGTVTYAAAPDHPAGEVTLRYQAELRFGAGTLPVAGAGTLTVAVRGAVAVTLSAAPDPVRAGEEITLTAEVARRAGGGPAPTGTVEFRAGGEPLGRAPLPSPALTVTLPAGAHDLTAVYAGDHTYQPAPSAAVPVTVVETPACDRTVSGFRYGPVVATRGVTCLAPDATVLGPVVVLPGAGLVATSATVLGGVAVTGAQAVVVLEDSTVLGPVTLVDNQTGDHPLIFSGNTVLGPVACYRNVPAPTDRDVPNNVLGPVAGTCS